MNDKQVKILKKWRSRYKRAQLSHSYTAVRYGLYDLVLGVSLIILTTASAILIFAKFENLPWLSPGVGVFAALLAYLQTFLRFSEKSESHRSVERKYGALKKEIEYLLSFSLPEQDIVKSVDEIRQRENEISRDAPHSIPSCWKKAKDETKDENEEYSVRNEY